MYIFKTRYVKLWSGKNPCLIIVKTLKRHTEQSKVEFENTALEIHRLYECHKKIKILQE